MITELILQQFKAHVATRIPLGRLTVLVGPNAAGKTSALEALWLLSRVIEQPRQALQPVFCGNYDFRWVVRRGATENMKIEVRGETPASTWDFRVTAPSNGAIQKAEAEWTEWARAPDPELQQKLKAVLGQDLLKQRTAQPPEGTQVLRGAVSLRLEASRLAVPSYSEEEIPRLAEDGYGLATVLSTMKLSATERFMEMESLARQIIPGLLKIRFKRRKMEPLIPAAGKPDKNNGSTREPQPLIFDELLLDYADATDLPAHAASEGTLLVLGILCALFSTPQPNLLLLDDMDRALHPRAQKELLKGIHAVLDATPDLQIVTTTHSPYLVDALLPDEVVFLARRPEGGVAAKRLTDHPKAELLQVLTAGELWTAEGESWVVDR